MNMIEYTKMTNEEVYERLSRIDFSELEPIVETNINAWIKDIDDHRSIMVVYKTILDEYKWTYDEYRKVND